MASPRPPVRLYRLRKGPRKEAHVLATDEAQARSWAASKRFVRRERGLVVEEVGPPSFNYSVRGTVPGTFQHRPPFEVVVNYVNEVVGLP